MTKKAPLTADLALLTIIPEAYEAVSDVFNLGEFEERDGYEWAWSEVEFGERKITVVAGLALDRENIAAATFTTSLIGAWEPKHLLLVDIGGAVRGRDDIQLGDVVTHTALHYYDFKKETEGKKDSPRHLPHAAASSKLRELSRRSFLRRDDSWVDNIRSKRPTEGLPKVLPGEMLVGGTLFANSPRLKQLLKLHEKVLAVEMEGAGVARGTLDWSTRGTPPEFLIVRGMSDFCNVPPAESQRTRDTWKNYACYSAAAHAYDIAAGLERSQAFQAEASVKKKLKDIKSNLWQKPNRLLTGRDVETEDILSYFSSVTSTPEEESLLALAISGEAGIGKSALARQAAAKLCGKFDLVWWLNGESSVQIRSGMRELAFALGINAAEPQTGTESEDHGTPKFLKEFREQVENEDEGSRALYVVDNVDDDWVRRSIEKELLIYLPPSHSCVIITSQSPLWHPVAKTIELVGLHENDGAALIAQEARRDVLRDDAQVKAISEIFGGRPLFLKIAATLLGDGFDARALREEIEDSSKLALTLLPEAGAFDPMWRSVYSLAIERTENMLPGCEHLISVLARLSADPIPREIVDSVGKQLGSVPLAWQCARLLIERSLIDISATGANELQMHRTISALVRTLTKENGKEGESLEDAAHCLSLAYPELSKLRAMERSEILVASRVLNRAAPHLAEFISTVVEADDQTPTDTTIRSAANLSESLGLHYWITSEWELLSKAYRTSVSLFRILGDEQAAALRRLRLVNVLRQIGKFEEAQQLLDLALPHIKESEDSLAYAWGLTVQARILRNIPDSKPLLALEKLDKAHEILASCKNADKDSNRRFRSAVNNYRSAILRQIGKLDEAELESRAGLAELIGNVAFPKVLTLEPFPVDELVATHVRSLGSIYRSRGKLVTAMRAHERALAVFEEIYGRDHTDIIRALDSLGRVQRDWGTTQNAIATFERAHSLSVKLLGERHAHVGTAEINLALTHLAEFDYGAAINRASRGCEIYEAVYGDDGESLDFKNEATAWAYFVKYEALKTTANIETLVNGHQAILNWRREKYGDHHPLVASSIFALAEAKRISRKRLVSQEVLNLHEEALNIRIRAFGKKPSYWTAQSYCIFGFLSKNIELVRIAHSYFQENLAPEHWRTRNAKHYLEKLAPDGRTTL